VHEKIALLVSAGCLTGGMAVAEPVLADDVKTKNQSKPLNKLKKCQK